MEAVGTARLTDRIPAERAVAASFSSREIRDVLKEADATPELTLDVVAGEGSQEHGTISMTWSRSDLENLLEGASGDEVVLTFDRNELTAALGDVETHGMRSVPRCSLSRRWEHSERPPRSRTRRSWAARAEARVGCRHGTGLHGRVDRRLRNSEPVGKRRDGHRCLDRRVRNSKSDRRCGRASRPVRRR